MQALTAELFGFAEQFRCFFAEENLKTVCFHPLFQNRLINRRAASIDEPAITALPRISRDFCGLGRGGARPYRFFVDNHVPIGYEAKADISWC